MSYIYSELYTYALGYFTIEYIARLAEELHSKYPKEESISALLPKIFSANYHSQEGDELIIGVNNESIVPYNSIVDIVNGIERGKANK